LGVRIAWEVLFPVGQLGGARLALHGMGAQSWSEGLSVFPDLGLWLWAVALVLLLTGLSRLVLAVSAVSGVSAARAPR
jgi:hypothetical protein